MADALQADLDAIRVEISRDRRRSAVFYFVLILTTILAAGTAVFVNVVLTQRTLTQQEQTQRRQGEQTRLATCLVVSTQQAIYRDPTVPTSNARAKALEAWNRLDDLLRCDQQ